MGIKDRGAARHAHARTFLNDPPAKGKAWSTKFYAYDFEEDGMLFLCWFDDTPKRPTPTKLAEACAAYERRFGERPNVVLVSESDAGAVCDGCEVKVEKRVGKDNYQVGRQEGS